MLQSGGQTPQRRSAVGVVLFAFRPKALPPEGTRPPEKMLHSLLSSDPATTSASDALALKENNLVADQ